MVVMAINSRCEILTARNPEWAILKHQFGSAVEAFRRAAMIPHILIIDADPGAAQTTRALVAHIAANATLTVEATPERGRISLQQHPVDVLIIDPSPDILAAAQLIRWLKTEHPGACVIVLAAAATAALRQRMEELGIDLYQDKHKPPTVLTEQLRGALEQILGSA
jgi:DNA-binding NarL/FixJ family response regulator